MSVQYKVTERINPTDLTLPKKFYARINNGDDVSFDELTELISKVSNLNYGTVVGAIGTLIEVIEMQLTHGRKVRLSNLGTFFLTLRSSGTDTQEEFRRGDIKGARIRFRPGPRLQRLIPKLQYEKVTVFDSTQTTLPEG
ncbi:DNA-binding protein, histone-like, putative [Reichenbachiella agariperforans]|uniref:DNA-binding protein, histone-like, putative n=1 Tax=Reichenbachiella agariperforans TaxID=156994 RepID=A0A1M6S058_REIAG|nr:HU family DNA-binding protein [Reichenbachiella agariperforans]SHK37957.1 DNA-binding protein, histone-like, putative [Reichenbachiella agariperforans]